MKTKSDKYTTIGHSELKLCSPLSAQRLKELIQILNLNTESRVLDLCAGKAEMSLQIIENYGCHALALDMNPQFCHAASDEAKKRNLSEKLRVQLQDVSQFKSSELYDLVICVGARPFGNRRQNLEALVRFARPGGEILVGEGFWRAAPPADYVEFLGGAEAAEEQVRFADHVALATELNLDPLYVLASNTDEMDAYDGRFGASLFRYIEQHPEDPEAEELLQRIRAWRTAFIQWGREYMGFAWYLYQKANTA